MTEPYIADARRLTLAGARKMVESAVAGAREAGITVSIAVVDAGGHLIVLERMDGGRFHTVHSATTKAVSAASNRRATGARGAQGQALDTNHLVGLTLAAGPGRWTAMEGGCPVIVAGECIGGIGVAGGDWKTDETLAQDAVAAIGATWRDAR
jgi:glc operon protein GlcG